MAIMTPKRKNETHHYILMPDAFHPLPRYSTVPWPLKDEADQLVAEAYKELDYSYRTALAKVRKALKLDPGCSHAFAFLADYEAKTPTETVEYYRKAVETAAHTLGNEFFQKHIGEFWDWECTRLYIKFLARLANRLYIAGQPLESLVCYKRLLELNRNDSMGVRYYVIHLMIELGHAEEADTFYETLKDENSTFVRYAYCLMTFRKTGYSSQSCHAFQQAFMSNKFVPVMLLKYEPFPNDDSCLPVDQAEAMDYCNIALSAWKNTPEALNWLKMVSVQCDS